MLGDKIKLKPKYFEPAQQFLDLVMPLTSKTTICIGGESGSGKSTLAKAIQKLLNEQSIQTCIIHMDDYFILPPKTNHEARLNDIKHVGPSEVNLELMKEHIAAFSNGDKAIDKPLVDYEANNILKETLLIEDKSVLIAEGTYVNLINNFTHNIFINRNYKHTYEARIQRARDPIIPYNERVLAIEHEIISKFKSKADFLLDLNYQISKN